MNKEHLQGGKEKMTTQKERAKWFKDLYEIYCDEFNEVSEESPIDEVEFNDELQNFIRENWQSFN